MSNKKQSSVEFLTMQLIKNGIITNDDLRQAKVMHKEETCDFALKHLKDTRDIFVTDSYDETFGDKS